MISDRERFLSIVSAGPMLYADALIICCGEDAHPRLQYGAELFRQGGAQRIVLSGGLHDPPRWIGAKALEPKLLGLGIAPDRIILEAESQNTREQAVACVKLACDAGWKRVTIVASAYHAPRAYLTFLKALTEVGHHETIQLASAPTSQSPWFSCPAGMTMKRVDLLGLEVTKINAYDQHVASYAEGLASLAFWERGWKEKVA